MGNPSIIGNRLKISPSIANARFFRDIKKEYDSFSSYLGGWTKNEVVIENGRVSAPLLADELLEFAKAHLLIS